MSVSGRSNEEIYREKWSTFVDGAIARQSSRNTTTTPGINNSNDINYNVRRIDFRDLMQLEEVLSRLAKGDNSGSRSAGVAYFPEKNGTGEREGLWDAEKARDLKFAGSGHEDTCGRRRAPDREPLASLTSRANINGSNDVHSPAVSTSKKRNKNRARYSPRASPRPTPADDHAGTPFITSAVELINAGRQADGLRLLRQASGCSNSPGRDIASEISRRGIVPGLVVKVEKGGPDEDGCDRTSPPTAESGEFGSGSGAVKQNRSDECAKHTVEHNRTRRSEGSAGVAGAVVSSEVDIVGVDCDRHSTAGTAPTGADGDRIDCADTMVENEAGDEGLTVVDGSGVAQDDEQHPPSPLWDETRIIEETDDPDGSEHMVGGGMNEMAAIEKRLMIVSLIPPAEDAVGDTTAHGDETVLGVTVLECSTANENPNSIQRVSLSEEQIAVVEDAHEASYPNPLNHTLGDASFTTGGSNPGTPFHGSNSGRASPTMATQRASPVACAHSTASDGGRTAPCLSANGLSFEDTVGDGSLAHLDVTRVEVDNATGTPIRCLPSEVIGEGLAVTSGICSPPPPENVEKSFDPGFADERQNLAESPEMARCETAPASCGTDGGRGGDRPDSVFTSRAHRSRNDSCNKGDSERRRRTSTDIAEVLASAFTRMSPGGVSQTGDNDETFASALSSGIAGFGIFNEGDAPSPVAPLREPLFASDVDDFGGDAGWESPASETAAGADASSPSRSDATTASFESIPAKLREIPPPRASAERSKDKCSLLGKSAPSSPVSPSAASPRIRRKSSDVCEQNAEDNDDRVLMPPPPPPMELPCHQRRHGTNTSLTSPAKSSAAASEDERECWTPKSTRNAGAKRENKHSGCIKGTAEESQLSPPILLSASSPRRLYPAIHATPTRDVRQLLDPSTLDSPAYRTRSRRSAAGVLTPLSSSARPMAAELTSISSFSESEGGDRILNNFRDYAERERDLGSFDLEGGEQAVDEEVAAGAQADVSLVEGTPRRRGRGVGTGDELSGFYAPLSVTYPTKIQGTDALLSPLELSTVQWMRWRESGEPVAGRRLPASDEGGLPGFIGGLTEDDRGNSPENDAGKGACGGEGSGDIIVNGGMLVHLPYSESVTCLMTLIQEDAEVGIRKEGRSARSEFPRHVTGLPVGATLIVTPTREAAADWSDQLEASGWGLKVLSYVMPLKERRLLTARQVASFDAVVTTYDILKAKEVPRVTEPEMASLKSPGNCGRAPGEWRRRSVTMDGKNSRKKTRAVSSKINNAVSLLHGVWWNRVVADGAEILSNKRSARSEAALGLVGRARWCVVNRDSMESVVEKSSDRMRSLASFLHVPGETALVEAASCLFYNSRPRHVAPLVVGGPSVDQHDASFLSENGCGNHDSDDGDGVRRLRRSPRLSPCTPGGVRSRARILGLAEETQQRRVREAKGAGRYSAASASVLKGGADRDRGGAREGRSRGEVRSRGDRRGGGTGTSNALVCAGRHRGTSRGVSGRVTNSSGGGQGEGSGSGEAGTESIAVGREDVTYSQTTLCFRSVTSGR